MLIAWIQQITLVDYPDKVAAVIFTPWCNFRCRFCHNPELVLPEQIKTLEIIPEEHFFAFLNKRVWLLDGVVITWWEPTLQPDLIAFCEKIKQLGFLVKLDTNGRDPATVEHLIQHKLVDYIAMDIKIDSHGWASLLQTKEKIGPTYLHTIELLKNLPDEIDYEFRTTLFKPYHTLDVFEAMLKLIAWAKHYSLQTYRPHITLDPSFDGSAFTPQELETFQKLALQYVQHCEVR